MAVLPNQGHAALRPKIHIGFVHKDHPVRVPFQQPPNVGHGNRHACRGVGIGYDHRAGEIHVVLHVQREILPQRNPPGLQPEEGRLGLIEPIGNIGESRPPSLSAKGPEGEGQNLVGAVAGDHIFRLQPVPPGNGVVEKGAGGVGIEAELFRLRPAESFQNLR